MMTPSGPGPGEPPAPTHDVLVARASAGDVRAFEMLAAAWTPGAWRLARAILPNDEEAAAAVQAALRAAWHELPRLADPGRVDVWLDRILLSECRMRLGPAGRGMAGDIPDGLLDGVLEAVRRAPPRPPAPGRPMGAIRRWLPTLFLSAGSIAVAVIALSVLVPGLQRGAADAAATSTPLDTPAAPSPSGPLRPSAPATPTELPGAPPELEVGGLAMVTLDGDDLRVRSVPGTGDPATRLRPLLPAGTRMLVVGGPVAADGYDWYQVQTDGELVDLFGWVATGKDGREWIAPTAPRCWGALDATAVIRLARIDFLACHGRTEVRLQADARALWDAREPGGDCGWVRERDGCDADKAWLLLPSTTVHVAMPGGGTRRLVVAMPPDLAAALRELPRQTNLALTVSLDDPQAAECRIRDRASGEPLLEATRAITVCRLQFVVQEVAFRQ